MQIQETEIRFAIPSDAAIIANISKTEVESGLSGWRYTPEMVCEVIRDNTKNIVVSETDNILSGIGIMKYYEDDANLDLIAVKPSFRRQSIGTKIVQWLEVVALTAGIFNIFVQVREKNTSAIKFYQSLEFMIIDKKTGYYRKQENAIIMSKSIRETYNAT